MNARKPLEVVDGIRGPEDLAMATPSPEHYRADDQINLITGSQSLSDLPPDTVEYHSLTGGLWLHLSDSHKMRDPDTGYEFTRPGLALKFGQGIARTSDSEVIHRIEGCNAGECQLHPRGLPQHPGYGIAKTLWRADLARKVAAEKQERDDVERFKANPEAAARLLTNLEAAGFVLQPRQQDKKAE